MTTGKLQIVEPVTFTPTSSGGADTGVANLITPDPKEVFQASGTGTRTLYLDFGAAVTLDSLFLGYVNADANAKLQVYTNTGAAGAGAVSVFPLTAIRATDAVTVRASQLAKFTPVASRYWSVVISANAAALQIGALAMGLSFEAAWDREFGSGRRLIDTGTAKALQSGGFGINEGARKAAYSWTFGDLTDAETEKLWGLSYRLGRTRPVIVHEREGATSGANEQLHYGLFQRFDQFERREPGATKWQLEIEEWI